MKSDPDRLDFLIVLLPFLLLGFLGFQIYRFVQVDKERASQEEPVQQVPATRGDTSPPAAEASLLPAEVGDRGEAPVQGSPQQEEGAAAEEGSGDDHGAPDEPDTALEGGSPPPGVETADAAPAPGAGTSVATEAGGADLEGRDEPRVPPGPPFPPPPEQAACSADHGQSGQQTKEPRP